MTNSWIEVFEGKAVGLESIPIISSLGFEQEACRMINDGEKLIVGYFAVPTEGKFRFFMLVKDLSNGAVRATSFIDGNNVVSLAKRIPAIGVFEREIAELHGINFKGNDWLKPLRYPFNRYNKENTISDYPFYCSDSEYLHQVHVGPVHAGIIEPGAFRFICEGEKIHHLEISLGYQHRGVEHMICETNNRLRQVCIAETIAGDTTVGHTVAVCKILEGGWSNEIIDAQRRVALHMERVAMHIADTGALAMDTAYQLGQVACEALRTIVINSMQAWCGNRFGRTLIRPFGCNYKLNLETIELIKNNITDVRKRFETASRNLLNSPDFLARIDEICEVDKEMAHLVGAVGISGQGGDILNRLKLRAAQVDQSCEVIAEELKHLSGMWFENTPEPIYNKTLEPKSLYFSTVNSWRGVICHIATTENDGEIETYKIYDPSMRNWMMLALSVRGAEISDFPLSNKSYNLSYCGNDL